MSIIYKKYIQIVNKKKKVKGKREMNKQLKYFLGITLADTQDTP